jgi:hypothetical protein
MFNKLHKGFVREFKLPICTILVIFISSIPIHIYKATKYNKNEQLVSFYFKFQEALYEKHISENETE